MTKTRFGFGFILCLILIFEAGSRYSVAQVVPSATRSSISLSAGGTMSLFDPDYVRYGLGGVGAHIDVTIYHGIGFEAEGRWQHIHELEGISQDNYLIGPRMKFRRFWRFVPYAKVLGGFSNMTFEDNIATGRYTTIAFGGGLDLPLNRRWSIRAFDAEYQIWPNFQSPNAIESSSLHPFGASAGVSYRIF